MTHLLTDEPALLSLLESARAEPHDDAPRLVLADWLDDHGESDRAQFVRLQLRLAPGAQHLEAAQREELEVRYRALLDRHGGCWLAGLWRWPAAAACWHRGLLTLRVPRRYDPALIEESAAWVDKLLFRLTGRDSLRRAADLLGRTAVNHAGLDLRNVLGEQALLAELARVPELPNLRSLSIDWPLRLLSRAQGGCRPTVGATFLRALLSLPLAARLTHLASSWPFDGEQAEAVRELGVEPAHARHALWTHEVDPSQFRATRRGLARPGGPAGAEME